MPQDLTDALIDHDEAAHRARALFHGGGIEAVQAAGFLVGWRGWGLGLNRHRLCATTFASFSWDGLWVRAKDGEAKYNTGPGLHALTTRLHGWARRGSDSPMSLMAHFSRYDDTHIASVIGLIAGWGETWPYTRGFRCRYATILGIHAPVFAADCPYTDFNHYSKVSFSIVGRGEDRDWPPAGVLPLTATRFVAETRRITAHRGN